MNTAILAAGLLAANVGYGVYRSCTYHRQILPSALTIDAIGAVLLIAGFYWLGVWK